MSKKKITEQEVEVLENELNYEEVLYCTNHFIEDIKNETKLFIHHTRKALERAQKQEKLLKLYQKIYNGYDDLTTNEEVDIHKQIKELEKNEN